ncbi:unnamed protein product [Orchesella dallaii]|uniref:TNFR-Cys domain-containing protein n=1 Tax=Orchesella dallaii TaxID=48710 RepID=A0ABP1RBX5_9HEXA
MALPNSSSLCNFARLSVYTLLISCASFQNVAGSSLSDTLDSSRGFRLWLLNGILETPETGNTDAPSSTNRPVETLLDLFDPEREITFDSATTVKYYLSNYSDYRIAVHLKTCDYDDDETIEIDMGFGRNKTIWRCSKRSSDKYPYSHEYDANTRHLGDPYVSVQHVLDNIEQEVLITTNFKSTHHKNRKKATIVVNLYRDYDKPNSCPQGFFDCYQPLCPDCCSKGSTNAKKSRCIPKTLKCDGSPNCGFSKNADETNEVCHRETYCRCQTLCLSWNYVLTSLAIAVLFIVTPTAVVFALFHRRHVALERARLERLAQARVTDMRGGFTRNSPANDLPPTYDEVYDTKEPPPCFCQAVALTMGVDSLNAQNCEARSNLANGGSETERELNNDKIFVVGRENLGFQCSCNNVSSDVAMEVPPSYIDIIGINDNISCSNPSSTNDSYSSRNTSNSVNRDREVDV